MATWRVNNSTALGGEVCSPWQADHAYALGARCVCTTGYGTVAARAVVFECTTAGTSGGSQPTWDYTVGNTTSDGEVTWTTRSPSDGSWDNASCYLYYITNHAAAEGDTIYVDDGHSESSESNAYMTITGSSSASNPIKIICVDKATDSLSTGAIVYHNPPNTLYNLYLSKFAYSYGITYKARCNLQVTDSTNTLFVIESGGIHIAYSGSRVTIGSSYAVQLVLINSDITLDNVNNYIRLSSVSQLLWRGGSLVAPNGVATLFAEYSSTYIASNIEDVDLSALGSNSLLNVNNLKNGNAVFSRCKVPSSYTPVIGTWSIRGGVQVNLYHCSSANRTYDVYKACYEGTVEDETTIVRTGGASDGTTSLAMKMVSSAGIVEGAGIALTSPPIHAWTSSTTSKTFTIEGIWDSAANIQDDEIWMELEYPANATDGLGAVVKDKCAILGTPADQTTSAETWTTTGIEPGINTVSWTRAPNTDFSTTDKSNFRIILAAADISTSGARVRVKFDAASGGSVLLTGASIGERDGTSGDTTAAPTRLTFNGGSSSATIAAGSSVYSDWITFTVDETKDYLVHVAIVTDAPTSIKRLSVGSTATYYKDTTDDDTLNTTLSSYSTSTYSYIVSELDVAPAVSVNEFKLSVTVTPGKAGPITARVCLAKPSTIVYIDPKITES